MSMEEKYGNFAFGGITFYDKESFDKVMDRFKQVYGRNIESINGKRCKGSGKLGLRTKEEKEDLRFLRMDLKSNENGTMSISGYGHRRGIFGLIGFMKHYFKTRDIVAYKGSDNAKRIDDEGFLLDLMERIEREREEDADLMQTRLDEWRKGKLPKPEGRDKEEER